MKIISIDLKGNVILFSLGTNKECQGYAEVYVPFEYDVWPNNESVIITAGTDERPEVLTETKIGDDFDEGFFAFDGSDFLKAK